jgi:hypothetical protein
MGWEKSLGQDTPRVGRPFTLLALASVSALVLCVGGYAMHWAGPGTAMGITALLLGATAMSWLSEDGRRVRNHEPLANGVVRHSDSSDPRQRDS